MPNKYDASWKFLHSLHLIAIFTPVFGFIGFFRRKACSGQKRWLIVGWIYVLLTVIACLSSSYGSKDFSNGYMSFYVFFYIGTIVYACVTLPAYFKAVIARLEDNQTVQSQVKSADIQTNTPPPHDKQQNATEVTAAAILHNIHKLNFTLKSQPIYAELCEIETVCSQILDYIATNPDVHYSAHTFTSYYLPEYTKLLGNYVELYQAQVKTDNILETMKQIQDSLPITLNSFKNLYDSLYSEKADDISASIHAMETVMTQDGLSGDPANGDSIQLKL